MNLKLNPIDTTVRYIIACPNDVCHIRFQAPAIYHEPTPFYQRFLRFLFGHVGLFFLVAGVAAVGKY